MLHFKSVMPIDMQKAPVSFIHMSRDKGKNLCGTTLIALLKRCTALNEPLNDVCQRLTL
jgi:hypothetical protein